MIWRSFTCYKLICSENKRKFSDPTATASDKLPWRCQRGIDTHFGTFMNLSEKLHRRRGRGLSSTNSVVKFDSSYSQETIKMKISRKSINRHIHILYALICGLDWVQAVQTVDDFPYFENFMLLCMSLYYFKNYFSQVSKIYFIYDTFLKSAMM